ncbi:MAG: DUF4013 domain-containing protein [Methanoculleus sp.]
MLGNSFAYTKDGLLGNWGKWLLLFISMVIFPLWWGYQWKIYRGESRMPPLDDWVGMFINGIKLFVVSIIYFIIPTVVFMVAGGAGIMMGGAASSPGAGALIGMLIGMIFLFVFSLIALMGLVRFARTDSFGEAFNFSAIITHIGEIGWVKPRPRTGHILDRRRCGCCHLRDRYGCHLCHPSADPVRRLAPGVPPEHHHSGPHRSICGSIRNEETSPTSMIVQGRLPQCFDEFPLSLLVLPDTFRTFLPAGGALR